MKMLAKTALQEQQHNKKKEKQEDDVVLQDHKAINIQWEKYHHKLYNDYFDKNLCVLTCQLISKEILDEMITFFPYY